MLNGPSKKYGDKIENIVIFLHGYGADGNDLLSLSDEFKKVVPNALFVSPNAPNPCAMSVFGYQWFSLESFEESYLLTQIRKPAELLNDYITNLLSEHNLTEDNLILIGFSQGAMMSLYTLPRREKPARALISFSGSLIGLEELQKELKSKPKTLLIHGERDDIVHPAFFQLTERALKTYNFDFEAHLIEELGHFINFDAINYAKNFLKRLY